MSVTSRGSAPASLQVWLLGRFAVERGGEPIPAAKWRRRRPTDVLKVLALSADHALHREELIDRIWPDKDLDSGANNLHRALHDLRRIIGEANVLLDKGVVRLASDAWVDVTAFEQAVARGDAASLDRAVELYRGDLCPDDPYADVLDARREALRQQFVDAAFKLARQAKRSGDDERAIDVLRRLVGADPAQELAHRMLMQALLDVGRRHDALRQFSSCVKALREMLDVGPAAETLALRQAIASARPPSAEPADSEAPVGDPPAAPSTSRVAPLVAARDRQPAAPGIARRLVGSESPPALRGRAQEVAAIERFFAGGPGVLVLTGEAGVGKSRLAAHAAQLAERELRAVVLAGLGVDLQDPAPYMPFIQAWTDYLPAAQLSAADVPFLGFTRNPGASMQENKLRLFQLARQSIEQLAGERPVVVVLEDLHLFDESSLHLVHYLARETPRQRLRLVITCRAEGVRVGSPIQALLAGLQRERLSLRLPLERLDRSASRQQIGDLLGRDPSPELLATTYALTGGNAFYTEELIRSLGEAGGESPEVSSELAQIVRERVARLGPDAERLLLAASTAGLRFSFDVARVVAGQSVEGALDALDLALHARLIEESEPGYRFRHALVREALYGALSRARR